MRSVRSSRVSLAVALSVGAMWTGCMGPILRQQSPELPEEESKAELTLVGNATQPYGLTYVKVEAVALVTGLAGTGEDPPPSPQRASLLAEMNRREVPNPNNILASPNTGLVLVRGLLRPGIRAGDHFDLEVRTPSRSGTTSLRGGRLLETRLTETAVLGDQLRKGHLLGMAQGPILVDPTADADEDQVLVRKGRVLGGGVANKARNLGLVLNSEHQSIRLSQMIGKSVSKRFFSYVDGQQRGMATPKTDEFVELDIHPRYKDNVGRYMRVVRSIALNETPSQLQTRLGLLKTQLLDPVTAATAAIRLEAIGDDQAKQALLEGIHYDDPEVRFYAAEALAYLDVTEAVEPLAKVVRDEPAFRVNALAALSAMDDGAAYDALRSLLSVKSAETRYGAFRAMTAMTPNDTLLVGESMNGKFRFHKLDLSGDPLIHVTSSHHPEIVFFSLEHKFKLPLVLDAGPNILVNGLSGAQIKVSNFGSTTQQRVVSTDVEEVIRAIVELGGDYPDVVQMLEQAKQNGALTSRFRVNALPEIGRERIKRDRESTGTEAEEDSTHNFDIETPEPELFSRK
ncbi:flagellar basal body P-ring protein FlgI [Bythopirellula polymerisocia]|uniref:Flagellar basal body P-ring protein n=1 Tax=Bythopirellula polymerisocia TaxID=2528003 RepID=A0A5C6CU94_9BACT|nr:HEAT repeat domain-containing protein [Bythopirellula polymerisocia]TWU28533.1 flagellar basal body P-ring protein [Bythopirellula polymerisocia]